MTTIAARIALVRQRIGEAVSRRGYGPQPTLVAVCKTRPVAAVREALAAGVLDLGENYAQELRQKAAELAAEPVDEVLPRWHFIGVLQSNKVNIVTGCNLIHTVDRHSLVDAIDRRAAALGLVQDVLVQVNIANERQKAGVAVADLAALLDRLAGCRHIRCRGLMLIPPVGSPEDTRRHFRALRQLRDRLRAETGAVTDLAHLSMGMSDDFEVAVEEGATIVRVGTAIFGGRQ